MSLIRLLSTDFDGTLVGGVWGGECAPVLARELALVVGEGAIWAVNTGRSLESALDGLRQFEAPVAPHYILSSERHLYKPDKQGGWHDYGDWNRLCQEHHDLLFQESGIFFDQIQDLASRYEGITVLENAEGIPEGLMAMSEELLDASPCSMEAWPPWWPVLPMPIPASKRPCVRLAVMSPYWRREREPQRPSDFVG